MFRIEPKPYRWEQSREAHLTLVTMRSRGGPTVDSFNPNGTSPLPSL